MSHTVRLEKNYTVQKPIPTIWRRTLVEIVEAIRLNDYELLDSTSQVRKLASSDANRIKKNINDYGCHLATLPENAWQNSICQWMIDYWDVLVDLYTVEEGESDLSLFIRVFEKGDAFEFEIMSVHVE